LQMNRSTGRVPHFTGYLPSRWMNSGIGRVWLGHVTRGQRGGVNIDLPKRRRGRSRSREDRARRNR
jgi:hypothetical protein